MSENENENSKCNEETVSVDTVASGKAESTSDTDTSAIFSETGVQKDRLPDFAVGSVSDDRDSGNGVSGNGSSDSGVSDNGSSDSGVSDSGSSDNRSSGNGDSGNGDSGNGNRGDGIQNADRQHLTEQINDLRRQIDTLCSSIKEQFKEKLDEQLSEQRKQFEKAVGDYTEFFDLYPDADIKSVPDTVWQSVNAGIPLAAAYALCERKKLVAQQKADEVNSRNRDMSSGIVGQNAGQKYLSPAEVRAMSAAEVKANMSLICESMSHWH